MSTKNIVCTGLEMAYSSAGWEYSTSDPAYAGYAGGTLYGVTILRFTVPEFSGIAAMLRAGLVVNAGMGDNVKLRWALCSSDANRERYRGTTEDVADEYRVDGGVVALDGMSEAVETRALELPTKHLKPGTWYLFLWALDATGVSLRAVESGWGRFSVSLDYRSGGAWIRTEQGAKRYAVYDGARKRLTPYILTEAGLKSLN